MIRTYKKLIPKVIGVGVLLLLAYGCRYLFPDLVEESAHRVLYSTILTMIRGAIHISLSILWYFSLRKRLVHKQIKYCMLSVAILMISWIFVRIVKFEFTMTVEDVLGRYIWYYFYVPMILIPLLGVYLVQLIGKPEGYKLPRKYYLLLIPALLLLGMIFTNDIHNLMFTFPDGIHLYDSHYGYGVVYFITFAWFTLLGIYFVVMLLKKSRVPGSKLFKSLPVMIMIIAIIFWLCYSLGLIKGDLTIIDCIIISSILESAIQSGLIPSNSYYDEVFKATTIPVMIVDQKYNTCYSSETVSVITKNEMQQAQGGSVDFGNTILHSKDIKAGKVLWQDDVTALNELKQQLQETISHLAEENELLRAENEVKENRAKADEKNRLYDRIAKEVEPQLEWIAQMLENVKAKTVDAKDAMAQICVVGSYIKRRGNLLLLGEESERVHSKELEYCFVESLDNLKVCGVYTSLDCKGEGNIYLKAAVSIYDLYEDITEKFITIANALLVQLRCEGEAIKMRMSIGCDVEKAKLFMREIEIPSGEVVCEFSEEDMMIEFSPSTGGEKYV